MTSAKMKRVVGPQATFEPFQKERKKTKCLITSSTQKREGMIIVSPFGVMSV